MPSAILVLACFLAGSLYTTALEGLVDGLHRRLVLTDITQIQSVIKRKFVGAFVPLSVPARKRLVIEATLFYRDSGSSQVAGSSPSLASSTSETTFVKSALAEVLWMDGKLTGLPLRERYDEYRAEGELRLGLGLLLPLGALAISRAVRLQTVWVIVVMIAATVAAIITCDYGLYYYRRAHSFLAHHIADGVVLTPSMETLKRNR
jgi:hypothetical protein